MSTILQTGSLGTLVEVILRAVGGAIDQYWNIFSIHKKQEVYDILESGYIGDVDPQDLVDGRVPVDHIEDPFKNDPKRDKKLMVLSARPCNAESPGKSWGVGAPLMRRSM